MTYASDGSDSPLSSLSRRLSSGDVNMDLTMCGLLVERAEELAQLYAKHGNWNDVKEVWFDERLSNRSTRGSSQKIYRVLTSRFKNASTALPNPSALPSVFDECRTSQDKAQILYLYLVSDDSLVRYVVHEYVGRLSNGVTEPLDFSNDTLSQILAQLEYSDGTEFDYADSTTERWCEGFRSVMREIGVLEGQQSTVGEPPSVGDVPLLVSMDYSFGVDDEEWVTAPRGLLYLFQPESRWEELFDRAASTDAWEYFELHGELDLRPTDEPYSWVQDGGTA
ncbi:BrxA family protein [Halomarina litorea]|uniref:BrxA family protein n=1 Tax=Halomarina litorea TaxID=2961595 RepID=UPI003F5D9AC6